MNTITPEEKKEMELLLEQLRALRRQAHDVEMQASGLWSKLMKLEDRIDERLWP